MKRVAMIDDAFLRLENRRQPLHIGVLMLLEPPEDAPEGFAENIAQKLRQYTQTERPFNQRLVIRRGLHYWEDDEQFDLDQHFVHLSLPKPGRIRELLAMVSRVHSGHLDRSFPLWRMYLIEGIEDGRIALYFKMHHAMADGMAGMKLIMQTMSTDQEQSKAMLPPWSIGAKKSKTAQPLPVQTAATGGFTALRSLTRNGLKAAIQNIGPVVRELGSTIQDFRNHDPNLTLGGFAPRCLINDKISSSRRFAAQSFATPRIKAVAEAYNATSNDVILAMCGSALRQYLLDNNDLPEKPLYAGVPVSTRRKGVESNAQNEINFTIAQLATHLSDPAERLRAIKDCMDYNKERIHNLTPGQYTSYSAMTALPGTISSMVGLAPNNILGNLVISHVPGPRRDMYWQGAKLSGMYPVSLVLDGSALNITIVSRHDFVDFGLIACRKTVPSVQRLLAYLEDGLAELEATLKPKSTSKVKAKPKPRVRKAREETAEDKPESEKRAEYA